MGIYENNSLCFYKCSGELGYHIEGLLSRMVFGMRSIREFKKISTIVVHDT